MPKEGEAAAALEQLEKSAVEVKMLDQAFGARPAMILDCLFGTGLNRPLEGELAAAAERSRGCAAIVVACDIPSGLCGDTGRALGPCVSADYCATFGGLKPGFFFADAVDLCASVSLYSLGYRADHYREVKVSAQLDKRPIKHFLLPSARAAHKGRFGRMLVLAGSPGMEGAALLTLLGARCGGVGLLHLWSPQSARASLNEVPPEVMVAPFAEHALDAAKHCDAIVVGPGLGRGAPARKALQALLKAAPNAAYIVDADALWLLADTPYKLPRNCVLTPHEGEALRLLGEEARGETWDGDRLALGLRLSERFERPVLLKGAGNLLCVDGRALLIPGVARVLARGGSGDLLAGLIAALAARGLSLLDAVHVGVRLQLAAAARFSAGSAELASQRQIAEALAQEWQAFYDS
jgi:NAD(P)H-hydrate epimerase